MKYFIHNNERHGTCYEEFSKGRWDGKTFWSDDSLFLHDDIFDDLMLYDIFKRFIPDYNRWGPNEITLDMWKRIYVYSLNVGGEVSELFKELCPWVEENFSEHDAFMILGV